MNKIFFLFATLFTLTSCNIKINPVREKEQSDGYWKVIRLTTIDASGYPVDINLEAIYSMPGEIFLDSINQNAELCFVPRFGPVVWQNQAYVKTNAVNVQNDILTINGDGYTYSYSGQKYTLTAVRDWNETNARHANDFGCRFNLF